MYRFSTYETYESINLLKIVKQRFYVSYDSCNILLPPESVYGIHVLNECNRIEFLRAYFCDVLNGEQYNYYNMSYLHSAHGYRTPIDVEVEYYRNHNSHKTAA